MIEVFLFNDQRGGLLFFTSPKSLFCVSVFSERARKLGNRRGMHAERACGAPDKNQIRIKIQFVFLRKLRAAELLRKALNRIMLIGNDIRFVCCFN